MKSTSLNSTGTPQKFHTRCDSLINLKHKPKPTICDRVIQASLIILTDPVIHFASTKHNASMQKKIATYPLILRDYNF